MPTDHVGPLHTTESLAAVSSGQLGRHPGIHSFSCLFSTPHLTLVGNLVLP